MTQDQNVSEKKNIFFNEKNLNVKLSNTPSSKWFNFGVHKNFLLTEIIETCLTSGYSNQLSICGNFQFPFF